MLLAVGLQEPHRPHPDLLRINIKSWQPKLQHYRTKKKCVPWNVLDIENSLCSNDCSKMLPFDTNHILKCSKAIKWGSFQLFSMVTSQEHHCKRCCMTGQMSILMHLCTTTEIQAVTKTVVGETSRELQLNLLSMKGYCKHCTKFCAHKHLLKKTKKRLRWQSERYLMREKEWEKLTFLEHLVVVLRQHFLWQAYLHTTTKKK